jgi:tetratricopeptide (TPR) repeat protein
VLQPVVANGTATAEEINELGIAYHWKKDYDNALKYYRQASNLDKTYLTSPLPILDHFKLYDEMIQIGEAVLSRGDTTPGVLTGLLNAYYSTAKWADYERVLGVLKATTYADPYDADYQRYVLAKAEVRAGRHEEAIAYIAGMTTRSLLQFMATASDFDPIANDPRFIEMTK